MRRGAYLRIVGEKLPRRDYYSDPTRSLAAAQRARIDAEDAHARARTPEELAAALRAQRDAQIDRDILESMGE